MCTKINEDHLKNNAEHKNIIIILTFTQMNLKPSDNTSSFTTVRDF